MSEGVCRGYYDKRQERERERERRWRGEGRGKENEVGGNLGMVRDMEFIELSRQYTVCVYIYSKAMREDCAYPRRFAETKSHADWLLRGY